MHADQITGFNCKTMKTSKREQKRKRVVIYFPTHYNSKTINIYTIESELYLEIQLGPILKLYNSQYKIYNSESVLVLL